MEDVKGIVRPASVAGLVGTLLLGSFVAGTLEAIQPGLGVRFVKGGAGWLEAVPDPYYQLLGALGLGYFAARTVDKVRKGADHV